MATEKPRFSVTFSDDSFSKIKKYKKDNNISTQSKAVALLVELAINEIESKNSTKKSPPYSERALKLARDYDGRMDDRGRETVRAVADFEIARMEAERNATRSQAEQEESADVIPFRRSIQPASAGTGAYLGPEEFEIIRVQANDLTVRKNVFGVPVQGDSMEPAYHDGDILIVEGDRDIQPGETGVFTINGAGYVKKLGDGVLISLNPAYPHVPMNESIICNGKVIGILNPKWIVK